MKRTILCLLLLLPLFVLTACQSAPLSEVQEFRATDTPAPAVTPEPTLNPNAPQAEKNAFYRAAVEREELTVTFSAESGFYAKDVTLTLSAEGAADIFYTDDGSEPGPGSTRYTQPIVLALTDAALPKCAVIRAAAYFPDGGKSPVVTHTYFFQSKIFKRFSMPIFAIAASPEELTSGPAALLVGSRALNRGEGAKRTVSLQMFLPDGTEALNQTAVLRVYGESSREMPVKSLLLIAGDGTEEEPPAFSYAFFDSSNVLGESMTNYRQLVLSNGEADFQYAFIRDELAQTLAKKALLRDYEDVRPAVVYLNGQYYGLHWLHEEYSDAFFHAVYGTAEGRYALIEWSAQGGAAALEAQDASAAEAFQAGYAQALQYDLTLPENREMLAKFMDVENYLDYCALNLVIDNPAWPGAMRAYACLPGENGQEMGPWRFLPHGMDGAFGLQGGKESADRDTLGEALDAKNARYAPLFAKLMEQADFRAYFVEKAALLLGDRKGQNAMLAALKELHSARNGEMQNYFTRLDELRKMRNSTVWMKKSDFTKAYSELTAYVTARPDAVRRQLERLLP